MKHQNTTMATVFGEKELNELACKFSAKPTVEVKLNDLQALRRALMHNIKQGNELLAVVNNLLGIDNNQ